MAAWYLRENESPESGTRCGLSGPLQPGDRVLLRFARDGADGATVEESLWTRIAGDLCGTAFAGYLEEPAHNLPELTPATLVVFDSHHVVAVDQRRSSTPELPGAMAAITPRVAATGHATLAWRVHSQPASGDSGWRFAADGESLDDFAGSGQVTIRPLARLLDRDPSLRQLLDAPAGTRFERFHAGEPWTRLDGSARISG